MTDYIDMNISGARTIQGGEYRDVNISGAGKIEGSLRCASLTVSGSGKVKGDVVCEGSAEFSGAGKVCGDLEAGSLQASGAFSVDGSCTVAGLVKSSGAGRLAGSLRADSVELSGAMTCGGDVTAERFFSDGAARIDGLLNAESVEIKLEADNRIRAIGGTNILVRSRRRRGLFSRRFCTLITETVEGDAVELEHTEANVVRGKNVSIGPGCKIGRVEYSENLTTAADAVIGEKVRI